MMQAAVKLVREGWTERTQDSLERTGSMKSDPQPLRLMRCLGIFEVRGTNLSKVMTENADRYSAARYNGITRDHFEMMNERNGVVCAHRLGSVSESILQLSVNCMDGLELIVRGWDSSRDPVRILGSLKQLGVEAVFTRQGAKINIQDQAGIVALSRAMFGFDEVWIGNEGTDWSALDALPRMTSEAINFDKHDCKDFWGFKISCG